ncbi:dynein light chain Tctex-type protein 2B [Coccinella septempunctata]|uniref:dynein light chain Tctex-type protein 2B n=1 Tax=Coccinella septempunctata TaxID=41139 RepID=UPI001D06FAE6|nr:dynein light chain Tctex-type protein 2B [Coccinella septempunctata]
MADEKDDPAATPTTEVNEQAGATSAVPAATAVQDIVQPLKDAEHEKLHSTQAKTETLELAGRKRSIDEKKKESLGARRSTLKERTDSLNSRAKIVLGSIISIKKSDTVGDFGGERGKSARYMNTYKLDSEKPFNPEKVKKILEEILLEALEGPYDEVKCPLKAKQASAAIRAKVKELEFDRYKLVCLVTIGEKHNQDVMIACRFLWDVERDRFAMFSHETSHVFGVALCFGLYYE